MTTRLVYRVASKDGRSITASIDWSQDGPTLKQAMDWCEYMNEVEGSYSERLTTYEVQVRLVMETPWESIQ